MNKKAEGRFLSILLVLLILAFSCIYLQKVLGEIYLFSNEYIKELTIQSAVLLKERLENDIDNIKSIAAAVNNEKELNLSKSIDMIDRLPKRSYILSRGIVTEDGIVHSKDQYNGTDLSKNYFFMQTVTDFKDNESGFISNVKFSSKQSPMHAIVSRISFESEERGYIFGLIDDIRFSKLLDKASFNGVGDFYIINSKGEYVVGIGKDNSIKKLARTQEQKEEISEIIENASEDCVLQRWDGSIVTIKTIDFEDWRLISIVPRLYFLSKMITTILYLVAWCVITVAFAIVLILNLAKQKSKAQKEQIKRAQTDILTGALNNNGFDARAEEIITSNRQNFFAIVSFDINNFGGYNALFGFESGDWALKQIAGVLKKNCEEKELFARTESDHFLILLKYTTENDFTNRILDINNQIAKEINDTLLLINYGVYVVVDSNANVRFMKDCSNVAKRGIKGNREKLVAFYDKDTHDKQTENTKMVNRMEGALKSGEFVAFYQPKYDVKTEKIVGAEALVRWRQADGSILSPGAFIEVFEKNGLITKLDFYIFEEICKKFAYFLAEGKNDGVIISSNFSRVHLRSDDFVEKLVSIADKYGVPRKILEIELTESIFFEDKDTLIKVVTRLKDEGFNVSIDDFGSGYSSLNVLKDVPVDIIKLDREFFNISTEAEKGKEVIKSIIDLAKKLKLVTVAEGVETEEQLRFLKTIGCDIAQGYYFSKPISDIDFEEKLNKQNHSC